MAESISRPQDRHDFKIAVICALPLEAEMVELVFDKLWDNDGIPYGKAEGDPNAYTAGVIANHNVILVHMPGMGGNKAATVATGLRSSYPAVEIAFVVGICGVVPIHPQTKDEIILGDCIISTEAVQYDFGRQYPRGFEKKRTIEDSLARASIDVRALTSKLITEPKRKRIATRLTHHLNILKQTKAGAVYPGAIHDRLFQAEYEHYHSEGELPCDECLEDLKTCSKDCNTLGCDTNRLVTRQRLQHSSSGNYDPVPEVYFGRVGSANTVMKSGQDRDRIAQDGKLAAFEMEGSGVCDILPTIIIKSACDYSDSHKSKQWQSYAAATAACAFKAFLEKWEIQSTSVKLVSRPKSIYMVPSLQNSCFTGRETYLQELEKHIFLQRRSHKLAIFGLGGIGKTQLALAFCQIIKTRYPDHSVLWVSAISSARFQQDYTKIAQAYSLPTNDDPISQVQAYLSSEKAGKWILIIDNADDKTTLLEDKDCIVDKLPKNESGITLFTTRHKGIAVDLAGSANIINLPQMAADEAKAFFNTGLGLNNSTDDSQLITELLEELTYLPLAIAQASSYIVKTSITVQEYLALLRETEKESIKLLTREFRDNTRDKESENAVAKTWLISFKHIQEEDPNAADILFFVALLENKAIPLSILPPLETNGDMLHALGVLTGYSFLSKQEKGGMYDMHRLVHRSIKIWMEIENLFDTWIAKTMAHMITIFPDGGWENRNLWQDYMTHSIRLLKLTKDQPSENRARLCLNLGVCLGWEGRYNEEIAWCSEAELWAKTYLNDDNYFRLESTGALANAYLDNRQEKEAINLFEWLIPCCTRVLGSDHPDLLNNQRMLATAYRRVGRISEAIELLEKVAEMQSSVLTDNHPDLLKSQDELASAYLGDGQVKKAIEILERVVAIRGETLAESNPDRLTSQHELASAYLEDGQVKRAIEIFEGIVAMEKETLAESHPDRLTSQHGLARAYLEDAQVKKAIEIFERIVAMEKGTLAESHPDRLVSQHELARVYEADGQYDRAILLMQHVVQVRSKSLPVDHRYRLLSEYRLDRWLKERMERDTPASSQSKSSTRQSNSPEGKSIETSSSKIKRGWSKMITRVRRKPA